ncbi:GIP, partial [Symbiodinium sp. KB8]
MNVEVFSPELRALKAGDKLWDDDERAEEEQAANAAEEHPLEGNHEVPVDFLYFVRPLKSKSSKHVMMAIQEIVLQLKQENLPVLRIHSDRAHEMRSMALRAWTLDNGIWLTRTGWALNTGPQPWWQQLTVNEKSDYDLKILRRLRTKAAVGADGLALKSVEVEAPKKRKELVKEIVDLMANDPVHKVRRPQLKNEGTIQEGTSYSTVGAYNFGGVYGITKYTREAPELTKKITQLLQIDFPGEVFTSATLLQNASMPAHKDVYNERRSYNLISPLQVTNGAGVWEELCEGDTYQGKFHVMDVKGRQVPGREGPRVVIAGHTIGSWRKLTEEMRDELMDSGTSLVEPEDVIEDFINKDSAVEVDEDIKRCAKAAVENLYTRDIEKVLKELDGDLKVVHTVHPKEVEENVSAW